MSNTIAIDFLNNLSFNLWSLFLISIYILGFLGFFIRNALCRCGEHFFFLGFLQSFVWFIISPYRIIKDLIESKDIYFGSQMPSNKPEAKP